MTVEDFLRDTRTLANDGWSVEDIASLSPHEVSALAGIARHNADAPPGPASHYVLTERNGLVLEPAPRMSPRPPHYTTLGQLTASARPPLVRATGLRAWREIGSFVWWWWKCVRSGG